MLFQGVAALTGDDPKLAKEISMLAFSSVSDLKGRVEEAEFLREHLSPKGKQGFDSHIKELMAPKGEETDPCKVLCGIRANQKWLSDRFVTAGTMEGAPSEYEFGIKNVIALFDLKSKGLCPDSAGDPRLARFHQAALPDALTAVNAEAVREGGQKKEKARVDIALKSHRLATDVVHKLENSRAINPETRQRWTQFLDDSLEGWFSGEEKKYKQASLPGELKIGRAHV